MGFGRGQAPGYGTWKRVMSGLDVEAFEAALSGWAQGTRGSLEARAANVTGVHLLSMVAHDRGPL
jgi:hypothetical protein